MTWRTAIPVNVTGVSTVSNTRPADVPLQISGFDGNDMRVGGADHDAMRSMAMLVPLPVHCSRTVPRDTATRDRGRERDLLHLR